MTVPFLEERNDGFLSKGYCRKSKLICMVRICGPEDKSNEQRFDRSLFVRPSNADCTALSYMIFHDVPVIEDIVPLHPLPLEFRRTPYAGIFEVVNEIPVYHLRKIAHG